MVAAAAAIGLVRCQMSAKLWLFGQKKKKILDASFASQLHKFIQRITIRTAEVSNANDELRRSRRGRRHDLVDALFLVDQVARFVHQIHQFVQPEGPVVEDLRGGLLRREVDDAGRSVRLDGERTGVDHPRQVLLALGLAQVQQFGHALQVNARVVVGDDAHVVLDQAVLQLGPALFAVRRLLVEDVEGV